jgi:hypothetical protein
VINVLFKGSRLRLLPNLLAMMVALMLAIVGVGTSPAFAEACAGCSPWWHLSAGARPSSLQPGQARDALQRVTLAPSVTSYQLFNRGFGFYNRHERAGPNHGEVSLVKGEAPAQIAKALEEETSYGAGNVEVTPVSAVAYDIKFVGELTDVPVHRMQSDGLAEEEHLVEVTQLAEGHADGQLVLTATNLGDAIASPQAQPVRISDVLPPGLSAVSIEGAVDENLAAAGTNSNPIECSKLGSLSCVFSGTGEAKFVPPYEVIRIHIGVNFTGSVTPGPNVATITGGGAPSATATQPLTVSASPTPFGVSAYELRPEGPEGRADTQAGSHPFQLTTTFDLNERDGERPAVGEAKDLHFKLPPGLIGNPTAIPRCSIGDFLNEVCPLNTVIGVALVSIVAQAGGRFAVPFAEPLFNLDPEPGEPARFGFVVNGEVPVLLKTAVRTGGDYGVTVNITNIAQQVEFLSNEVTFWGVPGDERHNASRGRQCLSAATVAARGEAAGACPEFSEQSPPPLLSLPTSCTGPMRTTVEADSWSEPKPAHPAAAPLFGEYMIGGLDGCNRLPFEPQIKVSPDGQQASKPTGLTVDVHVPQEGQLNPEGLAQSNIKDIEVTLPEGVTLNPSAADGLLGCSGNLGARPGAGQLGSPGDEVGFTGSEELAPGSEPGSKTPTFTPYMPGSIGAQAAGYKEALQPGVNFCPNASKIAEVTIKTPLLPDPLKGFVYLASPQNFNVFPAENPFGTHVAMYLVAEDPVSGSLVKLPGRVELGGAPGVEGLAPGQVRSFFEDNPQLPFEDAELHFFGGERAPLASPSRCGSYTTNATYTPWSGGEAVHSSSSFEITSGPNGSPCPGVGLPFSPSLESGTTSNNAGGFSNLTTTLSRPDGNQNIQSVTLHYPPGLSGLLSGVELCPAPQANQGACGSNSQIGETIVSVGVGGDPFTVTGGKVFITGPYNGTGACTVGTPGCAPFGLSIVNPAKAGPFNLQEGRPVVVRAKVEVDPHTAALTIMTNPSMPGAIPTIIEGFPLQIQHVNVLVNRPGFTFNPTNCAPTRITGAINSAEGASSPVSVPFQVTNCAALKFSPKFTVSTSGKTSKANGASLTARVSEPNEPQGSQANITKVKVELPLQLPSRLTTLQKACTSAQFEANPAGCPSASFIGHAVVHTPLIPVALEGPAIFVSHGNESFPSLTMVLQGYGVTIDLVGATFISNTGITSTTFKTVPDQPFSTFELTLPEGKYSALAANGDLCAATTTKTVKKKVTVRVHGHKKTVARRVKETVAATLEMPNELVAQNGAEIHQSTKISVTGCPKAKKTRKKAKRNHGGGKGNKKGKK